MLATLTVSANAKPSKQQSFADELTSILYAKEDECTPTLGVSMILSLARPGCTDDGITQIRDVMGIHMMVQICNWCGRIRQREYLQLCLVIVLGLFCNIDDPLLQLANRVWLMGIL